MRRGQVVDSGRPQSQAKPSAAARGSNQGDPQQKKRKAPRGDGGMGGSDGITESDSEEDEARGPVKKRSASESNIKRNKGSGQNKQGAVGGGGGSSRGKRPSAPSESESQATKRLSSGKNPSSNKPRKDNDEGEEGSLENDLSEEGEQAPSIPRRPLVLSEEKEPTRSRSPSSDSESDG